MLHVQRTSTRRFYVNVTYAKQKQSSHHQPKIGGKHKKRHKNSQKKIIGTIVVCFPAFCYFVAHKCCSRKSCDVWRLISASAHHSFCLFYIFHPYIYVFFLSFSPLDNAFVQFFFRWFAVCHVFVDFFRSRFFYDDCAYTFLIFFISHHSLVQGFISHFTPQIAQTSARLHIWHVNTQFECIYSLIAWNKEKRQFFFSYAIVYGIASGFRHAKLILKKPVMLIDCNALVHDRKYITGQRVSVSWSKCEQRVKISLCHPLQKENLNRKMN